MVAIRSALFNVAFYASLLVWLLIALPAFLLPYRAILGVAKAWGRYNLFLLRVICGLKADFRGLEKIPRGPLLVAAKHQSAWETFALLWLFDDPAFILKRELQWIPIFGWLTIKARMIPINRSSRIASFNAMVKRARNELAAGRQIVIFPEGTRRPAGAEPSYKHGIARLYAEANVPVLPIALNSGLFWRRRSLLRLPGTIAVQVLDPIPPGLEQKEFMARLQNDIETATARLIDEASHSA
jgi:1-acyl-sn-glycerol-3-phosphate acyltransferase